MVRVRPSASLPKIGVPCRGQFDFQLDFTSSTTHISPRVTLFPCKAGYSETVSEITTTPRAFDEETRMSLSGCSMAVPVGIRASVTLMPQSLELLGVVWKHQSTARLRFCLPSQVWLVQFPSGYHNLQIVPKDLKCGPWLFMARRIIQVLFRFIGMRYTRGSESGMDTSCYSWSSCAGAELRSYRRR